MRLLKDFTPPFYGAEPWVIEISGVDPGLTGLHETLLALSNGYIGARGSFEQGSPRHQPGVLVNGFYEIWPIQYPEAAYGYATSGQTIVYAPDTTTLTVDIGNGPLDLVEAQVTRRLDLRRGTLNTTAVWPRLTVRWTRLISLTRRHLLAMRLDCQPDESATIFSGLRNRQDTDYLGVDVSETDPRQARSFGRRVLEAGPMRIDVPDLSMAFRTARSQMDLTVAVDHGSHRSAVAANVSTDDVKFRLTGCPIEKRVAYRLSANLAETEAVLQSAPDFAGLAAEQQASLDEFWGHAAIEIEGDPALQQAINWALFQLHQASAQIQGTGIPAKGLTGQAYDGHYFWDTEVFVLPFLAHHSPLAAAELIRFRHSLLPAARRRAKVMSHTGALFPWRTINGEEASAYYEAGTAQYHIDAAVVYGIKSYLDATGDEELLWRCGVEIAVETARFWTDLGFFEKSDSDTDSFHIHMCTGPDEYSALVDDNAYTNHMARFNLLAAAKWARRMAAEHSDRYQALAQRLGLEANEIEDWERAAAAMELPIDPELGITPQDARFLEREPWNWETPPDQYPLLLHFHPLVIYRHQVLKQADVVMAMFLLPDDFSDALAVANFDYYDPITTGDSSLSAPVQAAVAARIGRSDLALTYFRHAAFLDLADLAGNTADGVHMATAGGVWQALVFGFGGFTWRHGTPHLSPNLPSQWNRLRFVVSISGSMIEVELQKESLKIRLLSGKPLEIEIGANTHLVTDQTITVPGPFASPIASVSDVVDPASNTIPPGRELRT